MGRAGTPRASPRLAVVSAPTATAATADWACPTQAYHESSRDWDRDATWQYRGPPPLQQQQQQ
ncbi:hypothetical protein FIBSPDRAFT_875484 [Athelia psychrophila]|uniref:Uncharacterized protein n=1 Tax=Athelia psychrophila TaxID=1759441 RepID=A0A167XN23_9AGAM|nr:hypothetical protein FIBSPDRAFT_875484 [Fibularhizoctonia sp. CBS 109695]